MRATSRTQPCWPPAVVWALLVLATGVTFAAGELQSASVDATGPWLVAAVLVLAGAKGALVALDFMELRHAPRLWRVVVLGWIALVIAGILAAYLKGLS